jgi:hypothetical protein
MFSSAASYTVAAFDRADPNEILLTQRTLKA